MGNDRLARIWSPLATQDLFDIWDYVCRVASDAVADKQLQEIDHICILLERSPELGKARDDVRKGLRSMRVDRYVVFYRIAKNAIEVVRVLEERRDVDSLFENEE